jgi:hypothetical protein
MWRSLWVSRPNKLNRNGEPGMTKGPHAHLTIGELQTALTDLGVTISNAVEEQHRICEELMSRAEARIPQDQSEVDWSVVRDAVMDTADYDGIGGSKALQASFEGNGLVVGHVEVATNVPQPQTV